MAEVLNANPTIRNASDLPSRRQRGHARALSKVPNSFLSSTVPASAYLPDPFSPSSSSEELSGDDSDDEAAIEPIDEQEIYGISLNSPRSHLVIVPYRCKTIFFAVTC